MTKSVILLQPKEDSHGSHFTCPTCKDEGLPALVLAIDESTQLATVKMSADERQVALDLLDGVTVGDYILVHLDTAIAKLNPIDVIAE